ncbi:MAG: hypothetical protein QW314_03730 [Thermoproteota archaeon]|nr:hypothetical protein [Candidatus Brockarchaeota archaeon]
MKCRISIALANVIQSHSLHVFLLAAPDYLGYPDAIAMARDYPNLVKKAFRIKKLANKISITLGGRAVHPISVEGFLKFPSKDKHNDQTRYILDILLKTLQSYIIKFPKLLLAHSFC